MTTTVDQLREEVRQRYAKAAEVGAEGHAACDCGVAIVKAVKTPGAGRKGPPVVQPTATVGCCWV